MVAAESLKQQAAGLLEVILDFKTRDPRLRLSRPRDAAGEEGRYTGRQPQPAAAASSKHPLDES
jgi:hypothetical protein